MKTNTAAMVRPGRQRRIDMCATKAIRIQRKRAKGWRMPANTVYVGRPTRWGNPFNWQDADMIPPNIAKRYAVEMYRDWLESDAILNVERLEDQKQWILDNIHRLAGKNLACWCRPGECCHADVLLEMAAIK